MRRQGGGRAPLRLGFGTLGPITRWCSRPIGCYQTEIGWVWFLKSLFTFQNSKLVVWLHGVMIDGLGSSLFLCYLEILQSLKRMVRIQYTKLFRNLRRKSSLLWGCVIFFTGTFVHIVFSVKQYWMSHCFDFLAMRACVHTCMLYIPTYVLTCIHKKEIKYNLPSNFLFHLSLTST